MKKMPNDRCSLLDDAGLVAVDLTCVKCGYNLRTQAADGVCPECAETVGFSLEWRGPMVREVRLALLAIPGVILGIVLLGLADLWIVPSATSATASFVIEAAESLVEAGIIGGTGWFLMWTFRSEHRSDLSAERTRRWAWRFFLTAAILAGAIPIGWRILQLVTGIDPIFGSVSRLCLIAFYARFGLWQLFASLGFLAIMFILSTTSVAQHLGRRTRGSFVLLGWAMTFGSMSFLGSLALIGNNMWVMSNPSATPRGLDWDFFLAIGLAVPAAIAYLSFIPILIWWLIALGRVKKKIESATVASKDETGKSPAP